MGGRWKSPGVPGVFGGAQMLSLLDSIPWRRCSCLQGRTACACQLIKQGLEGRGQENTKGLAFGDKSSNPLGNRRAEQH